MNQKMNQKSMKIFEAHFLEFWVRPEKPSAKSGKLKFATVARILITQGVNLRQFRSFWHLSAL
jgi:hypothetical protein